VGLYTRYPSSRGKHEQPGFLTPAIFATAVVVAAALTPAAAETGSGKHIKKRGM
jgi:hypothetical protein